MFFKNVTDYSDIFCDQIWNWIFETAWIFWDISFLKIKKNIFVQKVKKLTLEKIDETEREVEPPNGLELTEEAIELNSSSTSGSTEILPDEEAIISDDFRVRV